MGNTHARRIRSPALYTLFNERKKFPKRNYYCRKRNQRV